MTDKQYGIKKSTANRNTEETMTYHTFWIY